ncbi:MAG: hypothetical protein AB7F35_18535 [Acetobacteraceae bacterium]
MQKYQRISIVAVTLACLIAIVGPMIFGLRYARDLHAQNEAAMVRTAIAPPGQVRGE